MSSPLDDRSFERLAWGLPPRLPKGYGKVQRRTFAKWRKGQVGQNAEEQRQKADGKRLEAVSYGR